MDWGKFRDSLDYGHHQLGISEELDNPQMRAEAYLNLSRAHERLGCLERALMYARHSLYNECDSQSRNGGLVHVKYGFLNSDMVFNTKFFNSSLWLLFTWNLVDFVDA